MKKIIAILIIGMFMVSAGAVYAADGDIKWGFDTEEYISSTQAIGADGTIYIGDYYGTFYAINPDGSEKWRHDFGEDYFTFPAPAIGADGTIYVVTYDG